MRDDSNFDNYIIIYNTLYNIKIYEIKFFKLHSLFAVILITVVTINCISTFLNK